MGTFVLDRLKCSAAEEHYSECDAEAAAVERETQIYNNHGVRGGRESGEDRKGTRRNGKRRREGGEELRTAGQGWEKEECRKRKEAEEE